MNKLSLRTLIAFAVAILFIALLPGLMALRGAQGSGEMAYSEMLSEARDGQLSRVTIGNNQSAQVEAKDGKTYVVNLPADTSQLASTLAADGLTVTYTSAGSSALWSAILFNFLPLVLIGVLVYFAFRQMRGGAGPGFNFARSTARMQAPNQPGITFANVAGCDEAKQELREVVEFLRSPGRFLELGAKIPKGVLLIGPPGTGKTLLAKAVAGEAGVPFFSISGSEFVEMFVGVGASRVRDTFEQAKKNSPCIIFMDEIDAVGRHRGAGLGGGHDEREQTLNQLLVEMDGFDTATHVIVMAATNRPDILDPALLRPGRFDRHVTIDRPDINGRLAILEVHAKNKPLAADVNLNVIAKQTPGFAGADLANLLNEAAILAARAGKKQITLAELEEATHRVVAGPERRSRRISDEEKRIIAFHEAGHALVMHALPGCDPVHKISIISRGMALGWTMGIPDEDRYLMSKRQATDQLAGLLGGRSAEEIVFGDVTSGAENDIERATSIARRMITRWGMSEKLGTVAMGEREGAIFLGREMGDRRNYSEEVAAKIDGEVANMVGSAHQVALKILRGNRKSLEAVSEQLMVVETMDSDEFEAILRRSGFKAAAA